MPSEARVITDQEINEAVARKLGWTFCKHPTLENGKIIGAMGAVRPNGRPHFHEMYPDYCHSIAAAWEIVEHLQDDLNVDFGFQRRSDRSFWRVLMGEVLQDADTAPMAICKAFLKLP
jgi:hypothetical protein